MWSLIKSHPRAFMWATIVHVVFLVTMGVSFHFFDAPKVSAPEVKVVKATLKDDSIAQKKLKKKLEKERRKKKLQEQKKLKEKRRKAELKKQKLAKIALKKKREKELADKKRAEQELKKQLEEENKRIKQEQEAERQRKLREAELKKELEEEQQRLAAEQEARNQTIIEKQIARIKAHIEQRWIKPASTRPGMFCIVKVSLIPSGEVINVQYIKRSGNAAFDQSVFTAVKRSSPLPLPPVELGLSDRFREIELNFGSEK